jgi:hypothetical protein
VATISREINRNNMNNINRTTARKDFKNKKKTFLKNVINELATTTNNKTIKDLYRGINEFDRGYQPRRNLVKDENGDMFADSNNILNKWKDCFSEILNVRSVSDASQIQIRTA